MKTVAQTKRHTVKEHECCNRISRVWVIRFTYKILLKLSGCLALQVGGAESLLTCPHVPRVCCLIICPHLGLTVLQDLKHRCVSICSVVIPPSNIIWLPSHWGILLRGEGPENVETIRHACKEVWALEDQNVSICQEQELLGELELVNWRWHITR